MRWIMVVILRALAPYRGSLAAPQATSSGNSMTSNTALARVSGARLCHESSEISRTRT